MTEIVPAIIAKTKEEFEELLKKAEPYSEKIQVDIMDGNFVSNTTIVLSDIEQVTTDLRFQIHLMVNNPEDAVGPYLANENVEEIIFHIEATEEPHQIIKQIHSAGKKAGVAINPSTDIEMILPLAEEADFVQFMTVEPGAYGGEFVGSVVSKIGYFHESYPDMLISADGGVNPETAVRLKAAGVSVFIAGSFIFSSPDVGKAIEELTKIIEDK